MTSNRNASLEMTEETFLAILESETFVTVQTDKVPTNYMSHAHQEVSSYPLGSCGATDEEFSKPKLPVPHYAKLGNGGETKEPRRYESKTISEKGKNLGENGVLNNKVDYDKTQGVPENWEDDLGRKKLKGRVQDFVKVFNQESSSKPKVDVDPQVKTSENENREKHKIKKQTSSGAMGMAAERQMPRLNRKNALPDASVMMIGKFKQMGEENSNLRDTVSNSSYAANRMKNDSASVSAGSKPAANTSECIQEKFVIVQDSQLVEDSENVEDIQFSDDSIRNWSSGKEGNIRSLLSTLQFGCWGNYGCHFFCKTSCSGAWRNIFFVDI